jgi:hypothetical protein
VLPGCPGRCRCCCVVRLSIRHKPIAESCCKIPRSGYLSGHSLLSGCFVCQATVPNFDVSSCHCARSGHFSEPGCGSPVAPLWPQPLRGARPGCDAISCTTADVLCHQKCCCGRHDAVAARGCLVGRGCQAVPSGHSHAIVCRWTPGHIPPDVDTTCRQAD